MNWIKNKLKERKRLKQFKKDVRGIFLDWKKTKYTVEKDDYCLWVCTGFKDFKDYFCDIEHKQPFLRAFTEKERKILWKELHNNKACPPVRKKIFKEFNLND